MTMVFKQEITNAGVTLTYDPTLWGGGDAVLYLYTTAPVTLAADVNINITTYGLTGSSFTVIQSSDEITRNGRALNIVLPSGGTAYTDDWQFLTPSIYQAINVDGTNFSENTVYTFTGASGIAGGGVNGDYLLLDASLTLNKFPGLSRGFIWRGDASARPAAYDANGNGQILVGDGTDLNSVAITGDITLNNAGLTGISAGVIVDADINAAAAITRTKVANGTASHVVINSGAGALSSEAQLAASRGGTAIDSSASSGVPSVSAGTWSIGARTEVLVMDVSFEAAGATVPSVGDFKVVMPFDCTVTGLYAYCTKAIAATDNGTIAPKNNAGTTMTAGTITFTASDARGTAYTSTPSANNVFTAGDILTLTTAKTTAGGWARVSITYTRLD